MSIDTKHYYGELFEYGLKNGEIVHIDEVSNGLSCGCVCPDCETPLVAYNNPRNKKANHFRHKATANCTNAYETALHYLAKQIILETKSLIVPEKLFFLPNVAEAYHENVRKPYYEQTFKRKLIFDKVEIEKNEGAFRPDVKCFIGDKILLVEIAVTHFVDDIKRNRILQNNQPLLEIDLSKYERAIQKDRLIEVLQGSTKDMRWVYNPKIASRKNEVIRNGSEIREFVMRNSKWHKVYGKKNQIYDCPIFKDSEGVISVDNICLYCSYYVEEVEHIYEIGQEPPKYPEYSLSCIGHKASEFNELLKAHGVSTEGRR